METLAYCSLSLARIVRLAAGVEPLTCPPLTAKTFDAGQLAGRAFIYINLHGLADQPFWYGDGWITALSAAQLHSANLKGATIFAANCHLFPNSPMLHALQASRPAAIVGGAGPNFTGRQRLKGADRLGRLFHTFRTIAIPPKRAFAMARLALRTYRRDKATQDALESFAIWTPDPQPMKN